MTSLSASLYAIVSNLARPVDVGHKYHRGIYDGSSVKPDGSVGVAGQQVRDRTALVQGSGLLDWILQGRLPPAGGLSGESPQAPAGRRRGHH